MADEAGGGRGSHQRVVLEVDFAGVLTGSAHLTINPTNPALRSVYLHVSPHVQVNSVTLSSPTPTNPLFPTVASFAVVNTFQPLPVREPPIDLKSHQEIKRKTWAAIGEKDEGELAISVSHGWVRLIETPGTGPDGAATVSLAPIQIQIDYQLVVGGSVMEGIVFRRPGDGDDDSQIPHMFLSPTTYDSARIWTPCVDNLWERCTWELEFIVPRYLEGGEPRGDDDAYPVMVVASGELIEQVTHPHDPHKVIFYYMQTTPASVQHISFAAGPFEMMQVPNIGGGETQKPILAFCLPGQLDVLANSTSFLSRAMTFYTTEFGSFPFTAFKMVFVSDPRIPAATGVTMSVLNSDLLHPSNIIDQALETRQILSMALVQQWVGVNIIQRTLSDTWLIAALAGYIHGLFIRHLLGNNEYRFRLKKDIDRCVRMDQGDQQPLCMPNQLDPPSANVMAFMSLKGPLVLHILDRHIAKAGTSLGLSRVIPRIFLSSLSDELPGNMLSTSYFFRLCRKVSGMDLLSFQDQWVYGSGCPQLTIKTTFIRKKFVVEFFVQQQQPAVQAAESLDPTSKARFLATKRPTPFFEGSLTVRIHEADGAPFEHLVDLKQQQKMFPLPFNTKYKRTRRSGHVAARFSKLQETLAQADDNDAEQVEQLRDVDRSEVFAYPPWDNEETYREWRVSDWSEEEAGAMIGEGGGYEWIRVDPDCEWLAAFDIQEKPWFWISQLQGDRDVVAQLQAIQRMTMYPSPVIASELARTVLVENYYYRVRMEAARALVAYNTSEADYIGQFLLLKLFMTLFCQPTEDEDPLSQDLVPLPNDFSNFASYFLKKSMITALSELRDPATRMVWKNVRRLLLNVLKFNDNSANTYSDSYYMATLISAIGSAFAAGFNYGNALLTEDEKERDREMYKEATDTMERAMTVDRLVPSYHNVVTQAGLQAYLKAIMVGLRTNDPRIFLSYTREGNYEPLRLTAFDCLLLSRPPGRSIPLAKYLFEVIRTDYSLTIRRHVARAVSESIVMTLAVGEVYMSQPPSITEVRDGETNEQREKEREAEGTRLVKALRKDFNSKPELKNCVLESLMESFTAGDNEILFALIKAAEVISVTVPEPKLGGLITLTATPTAESPASSTAPKIRFNLPVADAGAVKPEAQEITSAAASNGTVDTPAAAPPIKLVFPSQAPPKEKKKKAVPKAQSRGLSEQDFKTISIVLQKMTQHKSSIYFRQPVDPVRDQAPDYLTIVNKPMDLSTAKAKLDNGMYTDRKEFEEDMRLIVSNCYLYNPVGSGIRKQGEAFQKHFNQVWAKTENTLKSTNKAAAAAEEPAPVPAPARPSLTIRTQSTPEESNLMPPPPVPSSAGGTTMKIKLKPSKSVTIDPSPTTPMAPPPVPAPKDSKKAKEDKAIARLLSPEKERPKSDKEKAKGDKDKGKPEKDKGKPEKDKGKPEKDKGKAEKEKVEKPSKKRRESRDADLLDDLLGEEVDAMAREKGDAAIEDLLDGPLSNPPAKKIKLSKPSLSSKPSQSAPKSKPVPSWSSAMSSITSDSASVSSFDWDRDSEHEKDRGRDDRDKSRDRDRKRERELSERDSRMDGDHRDRGRDRLDRERERGRDHSSDRSEGPPPKKARTKESPTKGDVTSNKPKTSAEKPKRGDSERAKSSSEAIKVKIEESSRSRHDSPRPSSHIEPSKSKSKAEPMAKSRSRDEPIKSRSGTGLSGARAGSEKPRSIGEMAKPSLFGEPTRPRIPDSVKSRPSPSSSKSSASPAPPNIRATASPAPSQPHQPAATPVFAPPPPVDAPPVDAPPPPPAYYGVTTEWPKPPADLALTKGNPMPFRVKRSKVLIQQLIKDPNACYFLRPVDPIRDGCPTYYDEIEKGSDYQTITKAIDQKKYRTMGELAVDIERIFSNCRQFNPPGPITDMAAINEALFWKEWAKAVSPKMTADEKKVMVSLLNRSIKEPMAMIFREPVDPIKLGIPQYFEIIPKEDARDLSYIKTKLERGGYSTARQIDDDFELMLENARVFNGEGPITDIANKFGSWWKTQRNKTDV